MRWVFDRETDTFLQLHRLSFGALEITAEDVAHNVGEAWRMRRELALLWARAIVSSPEAPLLRAAGLGDWGLWREGDVALFVLQYSEQYDVHDVKDPAAWRVVYLVACRGGLLELLQAYGDGVPLADILA